MTYTYNQEWWASVKDNCLSVDFDVQEAVKRTMVGVVTPTSTVSGHYSFFSSSSKSQNNHLEQKHEAPKVGPQKRS